MISNSETQTHLMWARSVGGSTECRLPWSWQLRGFLLSEVVSGGVELIVGPRRDPLFGLLVMAGLGGVTAELFQDVPEHFQFVGA